jgi:hypothetical protein
VLEGLVNYAAWSVIGDWLREEDNYAVMLPVISNRCRQSRWPVSWHILGNLRVWSVIVGACWHMSGDLGGGLVSVGVWV